MLQGFYASAQESAYLGDRAMQFGAVAAHSHRLFHSYALHAAPMRKVYPRVNTRTVRCLIDPRHTVIDYVGAVRLARRCGDKKQAEGSLDSPQYTAHVAIPRKRLVDGGGKGERDVQLPRRWNELVNSDARYKPTKRKVRSTMSIHTIRGGSVEHQWAGRAA